MRIKWADLYIDILRKQNIDAKVLNRVKGWIEKIKICQKVFFVKSTTYNINRNLYFNGIDKNKINDINDYMLVCGGGDSELIDIFGSVKISV